MKKRTCHCILWPCLAIVFCVLGWLSYTLLDLERQRLSEAAQSHLEGQARLTLWRMDSKLASLLGSENNRAPQEFFFTTDKSQKKLSPLFSRKPDYARFYFQIMPDGTLVSPQYSSQDLPEYLNVADNPLWEKSKKYYQELNDQSYINGLRLGTLLVRTPSMAETVPPAAPAKESMDVELSQAQYEAPAKEEAVLKQDQELNLRESYNFMGKAQQANINIGQAQARQENNEAQKDYALRSNLNSMLQEIASQKVANVSLSEDDPFNRANTFDNKLSGLPRKLAKIDKGKLQGETEKALSKASNVMVEDRSVVMDALEVPPSQAKQDEVLVVSGGADVVEIKQKEDVYRRALADATLPAMKERVGDKAISRKKSETIGEPSHQPRAREAVGNYSGAVGALEMGEGLTSNGKYPDVTEFLLQKAADINNDIEIKDLLEEKKLGSGKVVGSGELVMSEGTVPLSSLSLSISQDFISISPYEPYWINKELFLLRTVKANMETYIQGIWLDWDNVRQLLLQESEELLPGARLLPLYPETDGGESASRALSALPVLLDTGKMRLPSDEGGLGTLELSLLLAWGFALAAAIGVVLLLMGVVRLSERRATFVSAVTHELRTPLTTFNLYTEMLMEGLVPEKKRHSYFETLKNEAARLTHMVDNVLSFSRIEKTRSKRHFEQLTVQELRDQLMRHISPRLKEVGMEIQDTITPHLAESRLETDATAVEQIFYNFADNVAKYAAMEGGCVELHFREEGRRLTIGFRDHGSGLPACVKKKLFKPFSRSAEEAAGKKPGVGLGLALSREIARDLGGDLKYDTDCVTGTAFVLYLPLLPR